MNYQIWPTPGTVVFVCFMGQFRHYGIVSDRTDGGKPMVIANAWLTGGVREVSWDRFCDDRQPYSSPALSNLPAFLVLQNARRGIGLPYNLLTFNCEHFVRQCYGIQANSEQVGATVGVVAIAALSIALIGMASEV